MTTASAAPGLAALGWDEVAPLRRLIGDPDGRVAGAAAEAVARLPLTGSAWESFAPRLADLLDTQGSPGTFQGVARAAAHAPLLSLRRKLRAVAQDGTHPRHHAAFVALSDVGDDSVLAADVSRLLGRRLTDRTALRLAGLPLERLRSASVRIPAVRPGQAGRAAQSWWMAVAAARLGAPRRLDGWLRRVRYDAATWPLASGAAALLALRGVLPLPEALLARLDRQLSSDSGIHDVLRAAWLTSIRSPVAAGRPDGFAVPLTRFVTAVRSGSAIDAGARLAADAAALPSGVAPDPRAVYETWLDVASDGAAARPYVAWALGRAGAAELVAALAPWLGDSDGPTAANACLMVRDAAAWLTTPEPPGVPAGLPPWPGPVELVDRELDDPPPRSPWLEAGLPFDVGFQPESAIPADAGPEAASHEDAGPPAPAYARLSCPSAVVVNEEFDLELGLADRPTRGVTAQPLVLPERAAYTLTVQVVVDGFTLRQGEQPTVELSVTRETPNPSTVLHLSAVSIPALDSVRSILAVFSVDGHMVGSATRAVTVVPTPADLPGDADDAPATGVDTALPASAQTADLTITISKGDDIDGRKLLWSFQSPHVSVPGSAAPLECTLGSRPDEFARGLMRTAGRAQGESLKWLIGGKGRRIGEVVPAEVHDALRATAVAAGGSPSVLLLSADPYVPWELARVDSPWLPGVPAMLGAQAVVGRWALRAPGPTPEPPRSVSVQAMTVVRGIYEGVLGFKRLVDAEQEAADLQAAYGAELVDAKERSFFACLDGEPPAQVLHFAMHGKFDPTGLQDGLILVDGVVEPDMILDAELTRHPFVFLNACQVGQAGETLGQYGGMAQAFIEAGASAVIAPLWVVKDDVARDVSLRFYEAVFSGTSPAEFLRSERAQMRDSGTHLAYVLYGHPLLELTRSKEAGNDGNPTGP